MKSIFARSTAKMYSDAYRCDWPGDAGTGGPGDFAGAVFRIDPPETSATIFPVLPLLTEQPRS
jgi:hypothetical protein